MKEGFYYKVKRVLDDRGGTGVAKFGKIEEIFSTYVDQDRGVAKIFD